MRFLLDQNADRRFAPYLRNLGHDVNVIATDFGELAVRHGLPHASIILFRVRGADHATTRHGLTHCLGSMLPNSTN